MINTFKTNFYSGDNIDKVVYSGAHTVVNDGNTSDPQQAKIVEDQITNPYLKKCFIRYKWSIDNGSNWQSSQTHLLFQYTITIASVGVTSPPQQGLRAAVSCGVSDSKIYFRTGNGYHGNVTQDTPTSPSVYTRTPQTFIIQYSLFEIK